MARGVVLAVAVAALVLDASQAVAQGTADAVPTTPVPNAAVANAEPRAWTCVASLYGYFVPEDQGYAQPTVEADRGPVHLEARYNYEALKTGSAWLGYTFSAGTRLKMDLTPMLGGVFGDLNGIAPGCGLALSWSRFEFDSETEYVFDLEDKHGDFLYTWNELSYVPSDTWRAGFTAQRTRVYETDLDVQPGILAGVTWKQATFTAYVFNLGWEDPTVVLAGEWGF